MKLDEFFISTLQSIHIIFQLKGKDKLKKRREVSSTYPKYYRVKRKKYLKHGPIFPALLVDREKSYFDETLVNVELAITDSPIEIQMSKRVGRAIDDPLSVEVASIFLRSLVGSRSLETAIKSVLDCAQDHTLEKWLVQQQIVLV